MEEWWEMVFSALALKYALNVRDVREYAAGVACYKPTSGDLDTRDT